MLQLDELIFCLRKVEEAAKPGPWEWDGTLMAGDKCVADDLDVEDREVIVPARNLFARFLDLTEATSKLIEDALAGRHNVLHWDNASRVLASLRDAMRAEVLK